MPENSTEETTPLTAESRSALTFMPNPGFKKSAFDTFNHNGPTGTAFNFSSGRNQSTTIAVRTPKPFPATNMPKVSS